MKKYILIILVCLSSCIASAQTSSLWFQRLTYNDGLSDNKVNWLWKSREGYLWIGTQMGLNRYDGFRVQSFYKNPALKTTLPDNGINTIYEDADGMLWINTGAGMCLFDPTTDIVNQDTEGWMKGHGMLGKPKMVISDEKYNLWIASSFGKLYYYDFSVKKAKVVGKNIDASKLNWLDISGGRAYLVFNDGSVKVTSDAKDSNWSREDSYISDITGHQKSQFQIFADSRGGMWVWSALGVFHTNSLYGQWKQLHGIVIKDVSEDRQQRVYLATDHSGLLIADLDGNIQQQIVNDPSDSRSLPDNTLQCVWVDEMGVLWVGLYRMGVAHYYRGQNQFGLLPFGDICTMCQGADGSLWLGTNDSGIRHYNFNTKRLDVIGKASSKLTTDIVVSSVAARDGSVWFGSFQGGLSRIKNGIATHYSQQKGGLSNNSVWTLAELSDGRIVIGTLGGGVQFLNPATGKFTTINSHNSKLPSDWIASIVVLKDDWIAIGHSQGVTLMKMSNGELVNIDQNVQSPEGMGTPAVNQIYYDSHGLLWIATGSGLGVYDVAANKFYTVNLSENRLHSDVSSVSEDNKGTIWLTVGSEIKSINVRKNGNSWNFFSNTYGRMDGVQTRLFNKRSILCLRDGRMLFGGIDGVNVVNTNKVHKQLTNSKVIFCGVSLFDRPVNVGDTINGHVILEKELNAVREISLSHDENTFSIELASSAVGLPDKPRFLYRLNGEKGQWLITSPSEPSIQFANLAMGSYTLEVRPIDSDGNPLSDLAKMKITIRPPFYLSIWALIVYVLLIAFGVWYAIHRVRKKRRLEVEKIELNKEKEVDEAKVNFFTNIGHEFRTPLSLILGPLDSMIKHEVDPAQVERMKLMQRNAFQLQTLTNQMLDFRRLMGNSEVLHMSQYDIVATVKGICSQFAGLSNKGITLTFHTVKSSIYMTFDRDKTSKIVTNLLSNAYKFTPQNGRIDVSLTLHEGQWLDIKVADNGPGVSNDDKKHLFERFYQSKSNKEGGGSGIGLNLVAEYAKMQGGKATITDNIGGGSVFTVSLPFTNGHIAGQGYAQVQNEGESSGNAIGIETPKIYTYDKLQKTAKDAIEGTAESGVAPATPVDATGSIAGLKPLSEIQSATDDTTDKKESSSSEETPLDKSKYTVLLVDDNSDFLSFLSSELRPIYNIRTALNGQDALDSIHKTKPDIVITDIMMPVMDGNKLCQNIKNNEETKNLPVIILTARPLDKSELESKMYGADYYMKKPFNMQTLLMCINLLITKSRKS